MQKASKNEQYSQNYLSYAVKQELSLENSLTLVRETYIGAKDTLRIPVFTVNGEISAENIFTNLINHQPE